MKLAIIIMALITAIAALVKACHEGKRQREIERHIAQIELDLEMLIQNNRLGK